MPVEHVHDRIRGRHMAVAVVDHEDAALAAVRRLQGAGFANDQISLLALDAAQLEQARQLLSTPQGGGIQTGRSGDDVADEISSQGRDELAGVAAGGTLGLVIGLSVFAVPGLGAALLAAGPVIMAINVIGHTVAGGIGLGMVMGAIFDEHVTEDHRDAYKQALERGQWLVIVHGDAATVERAARELPLAGGATVESY